MKRAVFFDRDGTLMREVGFCGDPADVHVLDGAAEAVRRLRAAGFLIILVTNQSGIGRGYFTNADFDRVQAEFVRQLGEPVDAIYFCGDHPDVNPSRRKPAPDMLFEAAAEHAIDLEQSFMVGDREGDITAGLRAGCRTVLVLTGEAKDGADTAANYTAANASEAADWILSTAH